MAQDPRRPLSGSSPRGRLAALVAVAVLIVVLVWVGEAIRHHNAIQNCLDSGRRDCDRLVPS